MDLKRNNIRVVSVAGCLGYDVLDKSYTASSYKKIVSVAGCLEANQHIIT
jgi:hypothetical protein